MSVSRLDLKRIKWLIFYVRRFLFELLLLFFMLI